MLGTGYSARKANRLAEVGVPERAYAEMRRLLEDYLQRLPPQHGRFVAVVTGEERLREALSQRVTLQQVLDVMEQRWPYTGQRMALVKQIALAVGTAELHDALSVIGIRHGLARPTPAQPPSQGSDRSTVAEPSLSTQPSLSTPCAPPARLETPAAVDMEQRRDIVIRTLSTLTRSQWRDLAYELSLTVGRVEELERVSASSSEAVRRMLDEYFNTPGLHRGDQIGTLMRAIRRLNLNMTADRLEHALDW